MNLIAAGAIGFLVGVITTILGLVGISKYQDYRDWQKVKDLPGVANALKDLAETYKYLAKCKQDQDETDRAVHTPNEIDAKEM